MRLTSVWDVRKKTKLLLLLRLLLWLAAHLVHLHRKWNGGLSAGRCAARSQPDQMLICSVPYLMD